MKMFEAVTTKNINGFRFGFKTSQYKKGTTVWLTGSIFRIYDGEILLLLEGFVIEDNKPLPFYIKPEEVELVKNEDILFDDNFREQTLEQLAATLDMAIATREGHEQRFSHLFNEEEARQKVLDELEKIPGAQVNRGQYGKDWGLGSNEEGLLSEETMKKLRNTKLFDEDEE